MFIFCSFFIVTKCNVHGIVSRNMKNYTPPKKIKIKKKTPPKYFFLSFINDFPLSIFFSKINK